MTKRSLIQRTAVLLGLVGLSVFLFYIGKGHTILLDTNAVTIDGRKEDDSAFAFAAGEYVLKVGKKRFLKVVAR